MRQIHFGGGNFGLGFAIPLFQKAGFDTLLVLRAGEKVIHPSAVPNRNGILEANLKYYLDFGNNFELWTGTDDGSFEEITLAGVTSTDVDNIDKIYQFGLDEDIVIITTAIKFKDQLPVVSRSIRRLIVERASQKRKTFLVALENGFSTHDFVSACELPKGCLGHVVGIEASVDRICSATRLVEGPDGAYNVLVDVEHYARLVLEEMPATLDLKAALSARPEIVFTHYLDIHKDAKKYIVNGAHAVVASLAHYYDYERIDSFIYDARRFTHEGTGIGVHQIYWMAKNEIIYGTNLHLQELYADDDIAISIINSLTESYARQEFDRFLYKPDFVARVISRFKGAATLTEFFDSLLPRLETPISALLKHNHGARGLTLTLLYIMKLIQKGRYISSS